MAINFYVDFFMQKIYFIGAICMFLSACGESSNYQSISGKTMGTSYHITYKAPKNSDVKSIQASIDERLLQINKSMSTYDKDSTISKFNTLKAGESIQIDADFDKVLNDSHTIYQKSGYVFDPTVYPLVELWGFGSKISVDKLQSPPTVDDIQQAKQKVGLDKVLLNEHNLSKTTDGVGLDFSAIAKGYGVDVIADVLKNKYHIENYMVEIGGEVATLGVNQQGKTWTIAIDAPIIDSTVSNRQIATTISQKTGQALHIATSGNYRNMLQLDGINYSHTISPLTGQPIQNGTASVSVIAQSVALADGWATALSALPYDDAQMLANQQGIAAIFINPNKQQSFEIVYSDTAKSYNPNAKTP